MEEFLTEVIPLSMRDPKTGRPLTANVYTLEGVNGPDGRPMLMSIGQLVMAVCLNRAVEMEDRMVGMMAEMEVNTDNLSALTKAEELLQGGTSVTASLGDKALYYSTYDETTGRSEKVRCNTIGELLGKMDITYDKLGTEAIVTNIETKMDQLNTFSQEAMIELQSYTNKRDQAYDLISNVLKSLNVVLHGNANNL